MAWSVAKFWAGLRAGVRVRHTEQRLWIPASGSTVSAADPRRPDSFRLDLALGLIERRQECLSSIIDALAVNRGIRQFCRSTRNPIEFKLPALLFVSGATVLLLGALVAALALVAKNSRLTALRHQWTPQ